MATAPGDIYELVITTFESTNSTYLVNVLHFRAVTPGLTATSLIVDWRANIETAHRSILASAGTIQRYVAFNLIPFTTDWAEQRLSVAGTSGPLPLPSLVAQISTWRTNTPGRRYRGRTYWGPLSAGDITAGTVASGAVTRFAALPTAILARYGATGTSVDSRFGVWSRVLGHQQPPHDPAGFTQVTQFTSQRNLASMGSRRVGRGM